MATGAPLEQPPVLGVGARRLWAMVAAGWRRRRQAGHRALAHSRASAAAGPCGGSAPDTAASGLGLRPRLRPGWVRLAAAVSGKHEGQRAAAAPASLGRQQSTRSSRWRAGFSGTVKQGSRTTGRKRREGGRRAERTLQANPPPSKVPRANGG